MNQPTQIAHQERQEALNWLIEHFPSAFFQKSKHVKPLKIGIFDDIMDFYERMQFPPISKKVLREAINYYSASKAYLVCQKANVQRVDLFGVDVEPVTQEQADYALKRLEERYTKT